MIIIFLPFYFHSALLTFGLGVLKYLKDEGWKKALQPEFNKSYFKSMSVYHKNDDLMVFKVLLSSSRQKRRRRSKSSHQKMKSSVHLTTLPWTTLRWLFWAKTPTTTTTKPMDCVSLLRTELPTLLPSKTSSRHATALSH